MSSNIDCNSRIPPYRLQITSYLPRESLPGLPRKLVNVKRERQQQQLKDLTALTEDESKTYRPADDSALLLDCSPSSASSRRVNKYQDWVRCAKSTRECEFESELCDDDSSLGGSVKGIFELGSFLESTGIIIVRKEESLASEKIGSLEARTRVEVIARGCSDRRVRIRMANGVEGWVSTKKENGQALWVRCREDCVEIKSGCVLFAISDGVRVFYDAESSNVICSVSYGEQVIASGSPVQDGRFTMVPVVLLNGACGAIQKELLQNDEPKPRASLRGHVASRAKLDPGPLSLDLVYVVPPIEGILGKVAPRLVAYGDALTAESFGQTSYARVLVETLKRDGLAVELFGCGLAGVSVHHLAACRENVVIRNAHKQPGAGLQALVRPQERGGRSADLVLLWAGGDDLINTRRCATQGPTDIFEPLRRLHETCFEHGARTVAFGMPDIGGHLATPENLARRHIVNSAISKWAREVNEASGGCTMVLFLNPASLVPYGPRSRSQALWADGGHMTSKGICFFGQRAAWRLSHMIRHLREQRVLTQGVEGTCESALPLEVFLEVFNSEAPTMGSVLGDWELSALLILQAAARRWLASRDRRINKHPSVTLFQRLGGSCFRFDLSQAWRLICKHCPCLL